MKEQELPRSTLLAQLENRALRKWVILLIGLGMLTWLFVFAGKVREPGHVKRRWAVVASRVLVMAAGATLWKTLFVPGDQRVPVVYLDLKALRNRDIEPGSKLECFARLLLSSYEAVPLSDVLDFISERRYVPPRAIGIVVHIGSPADISNVEEIFGDVPHTLVVDHDILNENLDTNTLRAKPVEFGIYFDEEPGNKDVALSLKDSISQVLGREPICAMWKSLQADRVILKKMPFRCILGGVGFNRFGDEPGIVRLLDLTESICSRLEMRICISLFCGKDFSYPVLVLARLSRRVLQE